MNTVLIVFEIVFGIAGCLFIAFLVAVALFSKPPTWYEDLPPKNWDEEIKRDIEEQFGRYLDDE